MQASKNCFLKTASAFTDANCTHLHPYLCQFANAGK